jgi:hypothetical protein
VERGLVARCEDAGALERDIDAEIAVRKFGGVLDRGDFDLAAADIYPIFAGFHFARKLAVHGVETKQVRVGGDGAEIVDGDDFDVLAARLVDGAQDVAPDPSEAVDRHLHRHDPRSRNSVLK